MKWKMFSGLLLIMLLLSACQWGEADKFIEMESTKEEARAMIEKAMEDKGIVVETGTVDYARVGKGRDVGAYICRMKQKISLLIWDAFIHVDVNSKPRKLAEIDHLGLAYTEGSVDLPSEILNYLKHVNYGSIIPHIEEVMPSVAGLVWEDEEEKVVFNYSQHRKEKIDGMLELYADNQLAEVSSEEAEELLNRLEKRGDYNYKPSTTLAFHYNGEMDTSVMEAILQAIDSISALPNGELTVRVVGDSYNELEEPIYNNWKLDGSKTGTYFGVVQTEK